MKGMASVSGAHSSRTLLDIIPQFQKSKIEVGSIRLKPLLSVTCINTTNSRFPKLEDCAHFHYDHVDLQPIQLKIVEDESGKGDFDGITLKVTSGSECWLIHRTYDHFCKLDEQLHQCVFDRKFSQLPVLKNHSPKTHDESECILNEYVKRLSVIGSGCAISCGPALSWFELDNRGRRLMAAGHGINTPAVAAAFATTTYKAHATDELSFQTGDMISVIDMPPAEESSWWRGKRGFVVGFFPSHCVAVITDKIPNEIALAEPTKPVLRKHGKLIAFFRAFILARPSRRRLKQSGILRERVFGCDLSEHLLNCGRDIPLVLKYCSEFIEAHGIVDGIYRLSGVTSNIQKLRAIFDEDRVPVITEECGIKQDIHSVASLLKMYFRELPNPLCTYQLYDEFVAAVQSPVDVRLDKMRKVVQKLPPPHYRTLEYLMGHLGRVCGHSLGTGMTARNVAIVWAPNLLRCRSLDQGVAALQGVGVQAVVTEFLILYSPLIFSVSGEGVSRVRPKSLAVCSPTRLLSLQEAQARGQHSPTNPGIVVEKCDSEPSYHTVLELPRKRQPLNWRMIFTPRRSNQAKSPHRIKRKTVVKSAEFLGVGAGVGVVATSSGTCTSTHSRSVSHDSYFDTGLEQPSSSSLIDTQNEGLSLSLDLSELQMNFDVEESEMKIFSEDETNQLFSSGASIAFGPLENESNLEQRFSNQELRYIDSYSPDPMEGESPSEDIFSPAYQPLLTPSSYENLRVNNESGTSSKKSDISPFAYEKLPDSPTPELTKQKENELYEPCTETSRDNNLYESMDLENEGYEPVRVDANTADDSNIYEDIQLTPSEIYEKVSYLRHSVEELNRLAEEGLSREERTPSPTHDQQTEEIYENAGVGGTQSTQNDQSHKRETPETPPSSPQFKVQNRVNVPEKTERRSTDKQVDYENVSYALNYNVVISTFCESDQVDNCNKVELSPVEAELKEEESDGGCVSQCESQDKSPTRPKGEESKSSQGAKVSCSIVSEILKRDWVGRCKDASQKGPEYSGGPQMEGGKTEKVRRIIEGGNGDDGNNKKENAPDLKEKRPPLREELSLQLSGENDAQRRERIEKYKEERRNFFRSKYKTENLNNNDERDEELIRRIKQKTKKELKEEKVEITSGRRRSSERDTEPAAPLTKTTVSISYSPTKVKAPQELDGGNGGGTSKLMEAFDQTHTSNTNPSYLKESPCD